MKKQKKRQGREKCCVVDRGVLSKKQKKRLGREKCCVVDMSFSFFKCNVGGIKKLVMRLVLVFFFFFFFFFCSFEISK